MNDEQDEVQRLLTVKDFKKFKEQVIKQYAGKNLGNNLPGFDEDDMISVQEETGYLINCTTGKAIKKEDPKALAYLQTALQFGQKSKNYFFHILPFHK